MKVSESIVNNLLIEVETLTFRIRSIKQSFKNCSNKRLKERLFYENKNISQRVNEIYRVAELLNKKSEDNLNFSDLLVEKCIRTLKETNTKSNLFFL